MPMAKGRPDIAALKDGRCLWLVEAKKGPSLVVLDQAMRNLHAAHMVSVAISAPKSYVNGTGRVAFLDYCKIRGIGVFEVSKSERNCRQMEKAANGEYVTRYVYKDQYELRELVRPRLFRKKTMVGKFYNEFIGRNIAALNDGMKFAEPGNNEAKFWSPWRQTMTDVKEFLKEHPGSTMKEIAAGVTHHYATDRAARSALMQWLYKDADIVHDRSGRFVIFSLKQGSEE